MAYKDSDYTTVIAVLPKPKCIFFVAETHLGAGVMSASVFPSATIAQMLASSFVSSIALRKGPQKIWLHCHECCHALTLRCRNSPWCQGWERCSNCLYSFWLLLLAQLEQHSHHMSCALIGMWCKLAAYIIWAAFALNEAWVRAGGCKQSLPRYPQSQSRTCYQDAVATWLKVSISPKVWAEVRFPTLPVVLLYSCIYNSITPYCATATVVSLRKLGAVIQSTFYFFVIPELTFRPVVSKGTLYEWHCAKTTTIDTETLSLVSGCLSLLSKCLLAVCAPKLGEQACQPILISDVELGWIERH